MRELDEDGCCSLRVSVRCNPTCIFSIANASHNIPPDLSPRCQGLSAAAYCLGAPAFQGSSARENERLDKIDGRHGTERSRPRRSWAV